MALLHARFEEEQKEVCIISMDQLKLDEEVKAQDDDTEDGAYHTGEDDDAEEDSINLQEELFDEVNVLPLDGVTKETQELVQMALQSAEIIKIVSKLSPAS